MVNAAGPHEIVLNEGPGEFCMRDESRVQLENADLRIRKVLVPNKDLKGNQLAYKISSPIIDHVLSEQEAAPEEIAAIQEWLQRDGTCLLLAPHHDVGFSDDFAQRQVEYQHHGDPLVPRQQRFGQYTRSLMKALEVPVHNTWGLRPATVERPQLYAETIAAPGAPASRRSRRPAED